MRNLFANLHKIFLIAAAVAFFTNIVLFAFANIAMTGEAAFELSILSLINMLLLSFILLKEPNQKTE